MLLEHALMPQQVKTLPFPPKTRRKTRNSRHSASMLSVFQIAKESQANLFGTLVAGRM